jgi:hypothetical protein
MAQRIEEYKRSGNYFSVFNTRHVAQAAAPKIIIMLFLVAISVAGRHPGASACIGRHESIDTTDGADRIRLLRLLVPQLVNSTQARLATSPSAAVPNFIRTAVCVKSIHWPTCQGPI